MIEKIPFKTETITHDGTTMEVQTHASPYDLQVKINELVDAVNELQMKVGHLEDGVVCKVFDNDDTDDIAEVKNENLYIKSMLMDKEFAEEEMERLQKKLDG